MYALRSCLVPSTLVIMPKWNFDKALQLIPKYRVSVLTLIPSVVVQLLNHPKFAETDLRSLAIAGCGAAYLPSELGRKLAKILPKEASLSEDSSSCPSSFLYLMDAQDTVSHNAPTHPRRLGIHVPISSAGVLSPGTEERIVNDDSTDAAVGEIGELWLKGDNNGLGYWGAEGAKSTKETFVGRWLRTENWFWVDGKGNFFFSDRAKDTLNDSGSQVSPVEIENVLLSHPEKFISDVTVAGVTGRRTWIVLSDSGRRVSGGDAVKVLDAWHRGVLSKYKWLRGGIEVVDEIPKSPTGKVLRRVFQKRYEMERGGRRVGRNFEDSEWFCVVGA